MVQRCCPDVASERDVSSRAGGNPHAGESGRFLLLLATRERTVRLHLVHHHAVVKVRHGRGNWATTPVLGFAVSRRQEPGNVDEYRQTWLGSVTQNPSPEPPRSGAVLHEHIAKDGRLEYISAVMAGNGTRYACWMMSLARASDWLAPNLAPACKEYYGRLPIASAKRVHDLGISMRSISATLPGSRLLKARRGCVASCHAGPRQDVEMLVS